VNIDFSADPLFSWYVVLLLFSGVAMLVIGSVNARCLSTGWRVFNVVAGLGFVGYGVYLGFVFQGGHYIIFFKAFILPIALIVQWVKSLSSRKAAPPQQTYPSPYLQQQAPQGAPVGQQPNPYQQAPADQPNPYQQQAPQAFDPNR
jgi:hypothetical protein